MDARSPGHLQRHEGRNKSAPTLGLRRRGRLSFQDERWEDLSTTPPNGTTKGEPESLWPQALDLEALSERIPEPPKFIVPDWLPCGYATLFAGHGGVGKSGIALHLAVCIAAGTPFFGMEVQARRVLYLSC